MTSNAKRTFRALALFCVVACGCVHHPVHPVILNGHPVAGSTPPGVYYSLPKTTFRVSVPVTETKFTAGEWAECAEKVGIVLPAGLKTGAGDHLTAVEVEPPTITTVAVPDPDNVFLIELTDRWQQTRDIQLQLTEAGLLMSGVSAAQDRTIEYVLQTVQGVAKGATGAAVGALRSEPPGEPPAEKCKEALEQAKAIVEIDGKIRDPFANLPDGADAALLDRYIAALQAEREALLVPFYSTTVVKRTLEFDVDVATASTDQRYALFKTTSEKGVERLYPKSAQECGENVYSLRIYKDDAPQFSDVVKEASGLECPRCARLQMCGCAKGSRTSFYYRVPALGWVSFIKGDDVKLTQSALVSQWGAVAALPDLGGSTNSKYDVAFYKDYGALSKVGWTTTAVDPQLIRDTAETLAAAMAAAKAAQSADEGGSNKIDQNITTMQNLVNLINQLKGKGASDSPSAAGDTSGKRR